MKNKIISGIYVGFGILYILLSYFGKTEITPFLKPFIVLILILLVANFEVFRTKKLLFGGLIFSWVGDVILLFSSKGEIYFIFGLLSFLIAHLFYILLFWKQTHFQNYKNKRIFWVSALLTLIYLSELLSMLWPSLGGLKVPVFAYSVIISTMLIVAIKGYYSWGKTHGLWVVFGAMLFVASDSFLAINKFSTPFENANLWIMTTYIFAQFFIVKGILALNKK
jgi:uncharacterized membrane protein YhhN